MTAFKLGTRGSKLAMWQAEWVKRALAGAGVAAELVIIKTRGDAEVDRPLHELEGKGFFTKEIEDALRDGRIDVAVHSLKDLPTSLPAGLVLAAVPQRADPAEALVTRLINRAHAALADFAEDLVFAADQRPFGPHAGFFERRAVARAHGVIVGITGLARAAGLHSIRGSKKAAQAIS